MSDYVLSAIVGAIASVAGASLGVLATLAQVRQERWRQAGEIDRSDAQVLWQTQQELVRQLLTAQQALGERFDRLTQRLEGLGQSLVEIGQRWADVVQRLDQLTDEVQQLVQSQSRLEDAVRNGGGCA